jgi:hypothetical protein
MSQIIMSNIQVSRFIKPFFLASAIGIHPLATMAASDPQQLVEQCEAAIKQKSADPGTAETCLDAEKTIRSASPNSKEHVRILEQLALLTGYNDKFKKTDNKAYYEQALQAAQAGFGDQSPETVTPRKNLAAIANAAGDWQGARKFFLEVLPVARKNPGIMSGGIPVERSTLDGIAKTYRAEKKDSPQTYKIADHLQTEKELLNVLRKMKLEKVWEKRDIGSALLEIGNLEMEAGMKDQAEKDTNEALTVFKETMGGGFIAMAEKQLEKIKAMK